MSVARQTLFVCRNNSERIKGRVWAWRWLITSALDFVGSCDKKPSEHSQRSPRRQRPITGVINPLTAHPHQPQESKEAQWHDGTQIKGLTRNRQLLWALSRTAEVQPQAHCPGTRYGVQGTVFWDGTGILQDVQGKKMEKREVFRWFREEQVWEKKGKRIKTAGHVWLDECSLFCIITFFSKSFLGGKVHVPSALETGKSWLTVCVQSLYPKLL